MSRLDDILALTIDIMSSSPEMAICNIIYQFYNIDDDDGVIYSEEYENSDLINKYKEKVSENYEAGKYSFYLSDDGQYIRNDYAAFDKACEEFLTYINECDPDFFEQVCMVVLYYYDYKDVFVTSKSNDGGIDFIAQSKILNNQVEGMFSELTILGQAKRYGKTTVGISNIRDFIGSTEIIRCGGYKEVPGEISVPSQDYSKYKPFAALARLFVTSGTYSGNAKKFAEWLGLRMIDGHELARILHHYSIGFIRSRFHVEFVAKLFEKKINSIIRDIELSRQLDRSS